MFVQALGELASVELITNEARQKTPANEFMHLEAGAAHIFNGETTIIRAHRPLHCGQFGKGTVAQSVMGLFWRSGGLQQVERS